MINKIIIELSENDLIKMISQSNHIIIIVEYLILI